jgi:hypothetical protein
MKKQLVLLRVAGILSLFFMVMHIAMNTLFKWDVTLACLSTENKAIFMTYHYACIITTGFMGLVSLFQTRLLLESRLMESVLAFFSGFYILRIVTEFTLFGVSFHSLVILTPCFIIAAIFIAPIINKIYNVNK